MPCTLHCSCKLHSHCGIMLVGPSFPHIRLPTTPHPNMGRMLFCPPQADLAEAHKADPLEPTMTAEEVLEVDKVFKDF